MRACFKKFYMQSYFAKRISTTALASPRKMLVKLKSKTNFTGEVKLC
jgi:hypothetical protein